jgi:hypothetical protein
MSIERIIEDIDSMFDKAWMEYGNILNANKYYESLLKYFRGRYDQMVDVRDYFLNNYRKDVVSEKVRCQ